MKKPEINIQKFLDDMEKEANLKEGPEEFKKAIQNSQSQKITGWYNPKIK